MKEKYNKLESEYEKEKSRLKKDNQKLKKENENLINLCSELKIEVNRLENNLSMAQNYIEEVNKINNDLNNMNNMNSINNYESELNLKEIDDIKKKTQELIEAKPFNREHLIEPSKIKQEAKDTIEKVMREKIPENFYNSMNSINSDKFNENINNNNFINSDGIGDLDEFKFAEESKEIERGNDNNSYNSSKLKLLKRTKRK